MDIQIREARPRYLGHVELMDKTRLPYIALHHGEVPEGSRPKDAPRMNFRRAVKKDIKEFGINLGSWIDLARGRVEWCRAVDKGKVANMSEWLEERERTEEPPEADSQN